MKIKMRLGDIIHNDELVDYLGLNPWCVSEGADPNTEYEIDVKSIDEYSNVVLNKKENNADNFFNFTPGPWEITDSNNIIQKNIPEAICYSWDEEGPCNNNENNMKAVSLLPDLVNVLIKVLKEYNSLIWSDYNGSIFDYAEGENDYIEQTVNLLLQLTDESKNELIDYIINYKE